ncbi:Uma2 family endonuclease [candidate division KSB1 bacterium]|nr:Uma2 family endonuclease [candidate division KSB1 bacterium]
MHTELLTQSLPAEAPVADPVRFEEYLDWLTEEKKADLLDGVIYMQSPPSDRHEKIFVFLLNVLNAYVVRKKLGIVRGSRTAIKFSEYNGTQPDLVFISNANRDLIHPYFVDGAADMVVEIISPSTRHIDRVKKMALYAQHGVREYWLIDPDKRTAEFFRNDYGSWNQIAVREDGAFRSEAIAGFWMKVEWLFAAKPLDIVNTVMEILAGKPATKKKRVPKR